MLLLGWGKKMHIHPEWKFLLLWIFHLSWELRGEGGGCFFLATWFQSLVTAFNFLFTSQGGRLVYGFALMQSYWMKARHYSHSDTSGIVLKFHVLAALLWLWASAPSWYNSPHLPVPQQKLPHVGSLGNTAWGLLLAARWAATPSKSWNVSLLLQTSLCHLRFCHRNNIAS